MITTMFVLLIAAVAPPQEPGAKKIPNDSVEVGARGCFKGRVFAAGEHSDEEGVRLGPDISGRSFRMAAPKVVMADVKKHNGHFVEVVGIVKTADLGDHLLGARVGSARVVIGQPGRDPMRSGSGLPQPVGVPVMDVTAVRFLSAECPIR
jgi:hypothetical protein